MQAIAIGIQASMYWDHAFPQPSKIQAQENASVSTSTALRNRKKPMPNTHHLCSGEQSNVYTRDYMGEFGSVAGKREGKGSSIIYKDGKLFSKFVGEFIKDKAEGQGVSTYFDGVAVRPIWIASK